MNNSGNFFTLVGVMCKFQNTYNIRCYKNIKNEKDIDKRSQQVIKKGIRMKKYT